MKKGQVVRIGNLEGKIIGIAAVDDPNIANIDIQLKDGKIISVCEDELSK